MSKNLLTHQIHLFWNNLRSFSLSIKNSDNYKYVWNRIKYTRRSENMCWLTLTCNPWKDCKRELSRLHTNMETGTYSRRHSGGNIIEVNNTGNLTTVEKIVNLLSASKKKIFTLFCKYFHHTPNCFVQTIYSKFA